MRKNLNLAPIQNMERITSIDIIRALALFGVLLINLADFSGLYFRDALGHGLTYGRLDTVLERATEMFVHQKAVACFSMLFGIGLFIQLERAGARGILPIAFFLRRLGSLLLIGALHWTLLWDGEVLVDYALVGLFLLVFLKAKPHVYLLAALVFFAFAECLPLIIAKLHLDPRLSPVIWSDILNQKADAVYGSQSWLAGVKFRAWQWLPIYELSNRVFAVSYILPYFLLGAWLWRKGFIRNQRAHGTTLKKLFHMSLWLGLALCSVGTDPLHLFPKVAKLRVFRDLGGITLGMGYFTGLLSLLANPDWVRRLKVFSAMGRMALTNYLSHSLILTWVFYHYGLGYWGKVRPSGLVMIAVILYAFQVGFSNWWLARFKFGPAEWLWRSMTYRIWQPFRLQSP